MEIIKNIFVTCMGALLATLTAGACLVIAVSTISAARQVRKEDRGSDMLC